MTAGGVASRRLSAEIARFFIVLAYTVSRLREVLALWRRRNAFRDDLKRLQVVGPHMIADIGLTAERAQREIDRPLWQPWNT